MKARAQTVRREARLTRRAAEILRNRERHIERVLGTGGKRDQCPVPRVLDPVVDVRQRREISAENRRQRGFGRVLLRRRSLRVSDKVGKEEARDERAARRMPFGRGHGRLTDGTYRMAESPVRWPETCRLQAAPSVRPDRPSRLDRSGT